MAPAFDSLAQGFPWLVFYMLTVTAIYVVGLTVYIQLTPHKEFKLVGDGNLAAAVHLSALIIGLALPLAACLIHKVSLMDVAIWGSVSVLLQLFLFRATDMMFKGMSDLIKNDVVAPALVLAAFKVSGSLILAFAIAG